MPLGNSEAAVSARAAEPGVAAREAGRIGEFVVRLSGISALLLRLRCFRPTERPGQAPKPHSRRACPECVRAIARIPLELRDREAPMTHPYTNDLRARFGFDV